MQKTTCYLAILMLIVSHSTSAKNPKAILSYRTFYSENGPYIETYLSVSGQSVNYVKNAAGKYQAKIEISLAFKQNNEIKHADKYNLLSPELTDTLQTSFNFLDQQRIQLNNGNYEFEFSIADKNSDSKAFKSVQQVSVEYYPNIVSVSDIELVDSYKKTETKSALTKSGYEIIPFVNDYYPASVATLKFYAEIYNTSKVLKDEPFLVSYFIETTESKRVIEKFRSFKKETPREINVVLSEFPIEELPSGNYNIVVEVRNKNNDIIAFKETAFQRNNNIAVTASGADMDFRSINISNTFTSKFTSRDTLQEYIKSLRPISNANETTFEDNQLKIADVELMQKFLYNFWVSRNEENPEKAWLDYRGQVDITNKKFSCMNRKGYESERGRVFLQYGPPDAMQQFPSEPDAYPYEIWQYYKLQTQTNRKFVFYDTDLVSNCPTLLHSDATGEIFEDQWQLKLHKRTVQVRDLDRPYDTNGFGNNATQSFKNPK